MLLLHISISFKLQEEKLVGISPKIDHLIR